MTLEHIMFFAVDPAVDGVNDSVPLTSAWVHEKCAGQYPFASGREGDRNRVVHAPSQNRLNPGPVRQCAEDMRRTRNQGPATRQGVSLFGKGPLAPVDPAIGSQMRPVQIVGAAR